MEETIKEYSNGEVTVVWQPHKCIHSAKCWRGLPRAFNPNNRPWITLDNVTSEEIMDQIIKCPSGALSAKSDQQPEKAETSDAPNAEIVVLKNGPLMVKGILSIQHKNGKQETQSEVYLCRCGQSANKPFCDGAHKKCGFKDE
jgi:uncharacterized Fe-S cluster protein YjdI